jgi:hypothetical protein
MKHPERVEEYLEHIVEASDRATREGKRQKRTKEGSTNWKP